MSYSNRPHETAGNGTVRKFFRPQFNDFKRAPKNGRPLKQAPLEITHAENFYYLKQMNTKTPMVIVMKTVKRFAAASSGTTRAASR